MAIPKQVKKQSEAVQQLYKDLNEDDVKVEAESEAGLEAQPVEDAVVGEVQADRVEEQATKPAPEEQEAAGTQEDKTLEQKYKTLQGMYNAEVPRLNADKRELAERVSNLEQLLSTASQPITLQAPEPEAVNLITDQDMEDYGDSIDVMRRVNQEENNAANQRISQLEQMLNNLQSNVIPKVDTLANQQAHSSEQTFWSELSSEVPQWRDINENPDFQTWLLSTDPLTGISRQTYLEDAQSNFDARRVANFFSSWGEQNGMSEQAQPASNASNTSQLEKQVAPGKGKNTGTPANINGKTYSTADITQFYDRVRTGYYKGNDSERAKTERDIFAAQQDGRINA